LIQFAVGCYHLICGNYKGSFNQLSKAKNKLLNYDDCYREVDIKKIINDINFLIVLLEKRNPNQKVDISFNDLPKIETKFCEN
jgi:predicted metal-dependent hydrolase